MRHLRAGERAAIEVAISRAEKETSGEIVVVVTRASARYFAIGVMWAALVALAVPLLLILFTNWPVEHIYLVQLAVFALGVFPDGPLQKTELAAKHYQALVRAERVAGAPPPRVVAIEGSTR